MFGFLKKKLSESVNKLAEKVKTVNSNLALTSLEEHEFIKVDIDTEDDFRIAKIKKRTS